MFFFQSVLFLYMATRQRTIEQHEAIRREYCKLSQVKEFGVAKYSNAWIMNKVAQIFYKSPHTIERIVFSKF